MGQCHRPFLRYSKTINIMQSIKNKEKKHCIKLHKCAITFSVRYFKS